MVLMPLLLIPIFTPVYAAVSQEGWNPSNYDSTNLPNPPGGFVDILLSVINYSIIIVGLLCVLVFIYGGFVYLTAQGETDAIQRAKKIIIYAVIGTVVSVLGLVVVYTIDKVIRGDQASTAPLGGAPATSGDTTAPAAPGGPGGALPVAPGMIGQ